MDQSAEKEWRCRQCGTLLGVERGGKMHLKYKTAQFVVTGPVMGVCRRCAEINEITVVPEEPITGRAA